MQRTKVYLEKTSCYLIPSDTISPTVTVPIRFKNTE
jgi:hypothetical protein